MAELQASNSGREVKVTWHPYQVHSHILVCRYLIQTQAWRHLQTFESSTVALTLPLLQLNPQASKEGVNKLEFYKEKFGPRADSLVQTMTVRSICKNERLHSMNRICGIGELDWHPPPREDTNALPQDTFAQEGLQYSIEGLTGNTLDSHRLIAHAGEESPERQDALVEGLFKAYFTEASTCTCQEDASISARACI